MGKCVILDVVVQGPCLPPIQEAKLLAIRDTKSPDKEANYLLFKRPTTSHYPNPHLLPKRPTT